MINLSGIPYETLPNYALITEEVNKALLLSNDINICTSIVMKNTRGLENPNLIRKAIIGTMKINGN